MDTILGTIRLLVNGKEVTPEIAPLPLEERRYRMDARYSLIYNFTPEERNAPTVKCLLEPKENLFVESKYSGDLYLTFQNFYADTIQVQLGMGTIGDYTNTTYHYDEDGIYIKFNREMDRVIFIIAWLKIDDPDHESVATWLAADPATEFGIEPD